MPRLSPPATPGTYGNLGYNNLKGPGIFQLNVALSRTFAVGEKRALQLRAEAFNLPNHVNAFAPGVAPINDRYWRLTLPSTPQTSGRSPATSAETTG